ncbi:MAG: FG-GAP-like repeat-containing protein [bacterium]
MHYTVRQLALVQCVSVGVAAGVALAGDDKPAGPPALEEIICWGGSSPSACEVPEIPNSATVTAVSLGLSHGAVRLSDGTILLWGSNLNGQATVPTLSGGRTFSDVRAGSRHNLALLSDGSLLAWGDDSFGQTVAPALGGLTAVGIGTGEFHNLVIRSDGTMSGSGLNTEGQATPPVAAGTPTFVDGGNDHSVALLDNGTLVFWGSNADDAFNVPALAKGETYTGVACGTDFTVALKSNGIVVAAGNTDFTTVPATPVGNVPISVHARYSNAAFMTDDELVVVWGDDANEQLTTPNLRPYVLKTIAVGGGFLVADVEQDCDDDNVSDRDQIIGDPTLDCDGNSVLDACEIADDPTLDCNDNDILDVCDIDGDEEVDCDGNGRFDECEIEADPTLDCDEDGVLDACQITDDPSLDCDEDGALDGCAPTATTISSTTVSPIGPTSVVTATSAGMADPLFDVRVEVTIRADLGGPGEYMILRLNDTIIDYVFTSGGAFCPTNDDVETILVDKELWKALAPDGEVELTLKASPLVSNLECASSRARIKATLVGEGSDCNDNGTPDLCELRDGDIPDDNDNGIPDTCEYQPQNDVDGDGKGDLIWWNGNSRTQFAWRMSGTTILDEGPLVGGPKQGYKLITGGDFDGDGFTDLVYWHANRKQYRIHLMDADGPVHEADVGEAVTAVWKLLGTPDLNGDGNSDMIFWNSSTLAVNGWIMNGTVRGSNGLIQTATGLTFDAVGDIDNDGDDDILWRNASGEIKAWLMAGLTATEEPVQPSVTLPLTGWRCEGIADFDGDLKSDIIWRRLSDGKLLMWLMDGLVRDSNGPVLPDNAKRFDVQAVIDANGDMKGDIVWRDTTNGDVFVWIMDGRERTSHALVKRVPLGARIVNTP